LKIWEAEENKLSQQNPKLEGSNMVDCIPQSGECPLNCEECYYNGGRFYRPLEPLLPTLREAEGKIVRVNSGHDSNIERNKVIYLTQDYPHKFYNTSIPKLDFGAPVVLTINGRDTDKTFIHPNVKEIQDNILELMAVRFRVNTWNLELCDSAIKAWCNEPYIPFLLTDMRYYDKNNIQKPEDYRWKKHILNEYYCLKPEVLDQIIESYSMDQTVFWCGNPFTKSTYCRDCRLCEIFYWRTRLRLKK